MNGPQDTGDAQYMNGPQDTGDAQHMNGPQDTGDAQYMNGPQDTGDAQHMNGPQDTGDAQFDNHHGGYEFIGDGESEGAYLDYDESKLSSVKPVASKNNNIELNQQSDLPVNESNAPEDVDPGTIVTNVSKWSEVLGKELSELPIETLREIQALKPNEMLEINSLTPIGEFGFEELSEMKSTISTAKLVMTPWHGEPNNFGDKEWSLAMKLPDDMIPDWLVEPLAEKIKEQNNDVLQVENKEPEIDKNQRSESRRFSR